MAKSRAQRKAERRKREAQQAQEAREGGGLGRARAQHDTQVPESGEVAEAEAIMRTGAQPEELGEEVRPPREEEQPPKAPAPSRADVGVVEEEAPPDAAPAPPGETRRERKRRERAELKAKEERRRSREEGRKGAEAPERRRGPVIGFLASCVAELRRVQWPNRDTLIQASTVTILFVAVAATYLGALDALFNWLVQAIL